MASESPQEELFSTAEMAINSSTKDASDWEYMLAGLLLGTQWEHEEHGLIEVKKVRYSSETIEGQTIKYPSIYLAHWERRMQVSSFLRRIDQNDVGDIKPTNQKARNIVAYHEDHSWRGV